TRLSEPKAFSAWRSNTWATPVVAATAVSSMATSPGSNSWPTVYPIRRPAEVLDLARVWPDSASRRDRNTRHGDQAPPRLPLRRRRPRRVGGRGASLRPDQPQGAGAPLRDEPAQHRASELSEGLGRQIPRRTFRAGRLAGRRCVASRGAARDLPLPSDVQRRRADRDADGLHRARRGERLLARPAASARAHTRGTPPRPAR